MTKARISKWLTTTQTSRTMNKFKMLLPKVFKSRVNVSITNLVTRYLRATAYY